MGYRENTSERREKEGFRMRAGIGWAASLLAAAAALAPGTGAAQTDPNRGWLEGRVHDGEGNPLHVYVQYRHESGDPDTFVATDRSADGLYTIRDLRPGVYEVLVREVPEGYRPQRHFGVLVKPGSRTVLNITLKRGKGMEEIGKPAFNTEPAVHLGSELQELRKQVDDLRKSLEDARKAIDELRAKK